MTKSVEFQTASDAAANYVLIVILKESFQKMLSGHFSKSWPAPAHKQERLSRSEMHSQFETRAQTPTPAV